MVAGIVLITAGILIALHPPLLSMIVAILLILLGSCSDHRWYGCIVLDVRMPGTNGLEESGGLIRVMELQEQGYSYVRP